MTPDDEIIKFINLPYAIELREEVAGGKPCFVACHPELEGCMAMGFTAAEAFASLEDAKRQYIEVLIEKGWDVPVPKIAPEPSSNGTFYNWMRGVLRASDTIDERRAARKEAEQNEPDTNRPTEGT